MKTTIKLIIAICIINCTVFSNTTTAQIAINETDSSPDASAILDVNSTDKGILIPRMTTTERDSINSPATGLLVYDTDYNSFWYYVDSVWLNLNTSFVSDLDGDTKIQVEENSDEDIIRFDLGGTEYFRMEGHQFITPLNNVFIGDGAGQNDLLQSSGNVFVGNQAGNLTEDGIYNVAVGTFSLRDNVSGDYNSAYGFNSLRDNTSGEYNVAYGINSLVNNESGTYNTALGPFALEGEISGKWNTAIGVAAMVSDTTSQGNTSVGGYSLYDNKSGNYNTAFGYEANSYSSNASKTVAIGAYALQYNTGTGSNVAIGYRAGRSSGSSTGNIFIGYQAGQSESNSNRLYIENSNSSSPLIYGEFDNDILNFNGDVTVTGDLDINTNGIFSGNFAIGTASSGSESTFQDNSSATNDGYLTTPWLYTNAIEATGERGSGSTAITVGDDGNFGANDEIHLITSGTSALMVNSDGNIGIGTTSPTQGKLVISGTGATQSFSNGNYGYWSYNGYAYGQSSLSNTNYAIYTDERIAAWVYHAISDERVKDIQGITDNAADLETLKKIKITDYQFKDKIKNGDITQKKVIAQQVAEVYPQAVTTNTTEIVPNIMKPATMDEQGWVSFNSKWTIENPEISGHSGELKVGEKVQILFDDKKELLEVLEIKENTFRVKPSTVNRGTSVRQSSNEVSVFVYGRQVNDFHTVDYEAISMLNVSATQELAKKVEQLEKENAALKSQVDKINQLETIVQQLQAQLENQ